MKLTLRIRLTCSHSGPNVKYTKALAHPGRDHRVSVKFCKFSNYRQPFSEWVSCGTTPKLGNEVKHETHHIVEFFYFNASQNDLLFTLKK